jgi:hypothetical protein
MAGAYTIDRPAVAALLYGKVYAPGDMISIYFDLDRRARAVQTRARVLVGKRTGHLAARITLSSRAVPPFWWFTVTGDTRYAYYHHRGTKPHIITGSLEFRSGGRMVHTRMVHHPGTRPNPFLSRALPAFMSLRDHVDLRPGAAL